MNTISFLAASGNLISVTMAGEGPPLLLLHGFPLDHRQWLPQLSKLAAHFRVIAPDLRGFGRSTLTEQQYTLAELAGDVEQVRQHLAPQEPIALCGLSMGGYVAFEYWRQYASNLKALILSNTKPEADTPEAREAREQMCSLARQSGNWEAVSPMLPKLLTTRHASTSSSVYSATLEMLKACSVEAICAAQHALARRADFIARLPAVDTPTLVITGAEDTIAPAQHTRKWAAVMPNSTCHVISDAAHLSPLEAPEEFNRTVHSFLQSVLL